MSESPEIKCLNADELSAMMGRDNLVIVDIRDPQSYVNDHIPGALALNSDDDVKNFLEKTAKTKTIVCCCYHGISSRRAAAYLKAQGFEDIYSLDGGFEGWKVRKTA